ncbi:MAG: ribose 5-phosphate isomerase B [Candidatus Omnitrophota bacterium]|jgi:ribose 5-phosphate isomerase B
MMDKILIASDHAGFNLKEKLKTYLLKKNLQVIDLGTCSKERCDYPEFAYSLATRISIGKFKRGILICKTGIGNSIMANRLRGVRAALVYNVKAARLSREHNDSNVLVLGAAFVNKKLGERIIDTWLKTKFQKGRHLKRLNLIKKFEREAR